MRIVGLSSHAIAERGFSAEERKDNTEQIAFVAAELARAGAAVITAPVAPSETSRIAAKNTVLHNGGAGGNFFLIHVATPLEECEKRDRRQVYARARRGEIKGVVGVDEVYDAPERADLTVDALMQGIPEIVHSECICPVFFIVLNGGCRYYAFIRVKFAFVILFRKGNSFFNVLTSLSAAFMMI